MEDDSACEDHNRLVEVENEMKDISVFDDLSGIVIACGEFVVG